MFFKPDTVTRVLIAVSILAVGFTFDSSICLALGWHEEVQEAKQMINQKLVDPTEQVPARARILRNMKAFCDQVTNDAQWTEAKEPLYSILDQKLDWTNQDEWILENWFIEGSVFDLDPPSFKYYGVLNKEATKTSLGKLVPKHFGEWINSINSNGAWRKKGSVFIPLKTLPKLLEKLNGVLTVIRGLEPELSLDEKFEVAGRRIRPLLGNGLELPPSTSRSDDLQIVPSFSSLLEMADLADEEIGKHRRGQALVKREREEGEEVVQTPHAEGATKHVKREESALHVPPAMIRVTQPLPPAPENTGETSLKFKLMKTQVLDEDLVESLQSLCGDSPDVCVVEGRPVSMLLSLYQVRGFDAVQAALRRSVFNLDYKMAPNDPMTVGEHLVILALSTAGPIRANALVADSSIPMSEGTRIDEAKLVLDYLLMKVASPDHFRVFLATYEKFPNVYLALKARLQENFRLAIEQNNLANITWWIHSGLVNLNE